MSRKSNAFESGDVFWAPDPYNEGSNPRLWLVLAADNIPYAGEEYVCAGFTHYEAEAPPSRSAGLPMLNRKHKRVGWGGSRQQVC
jgi:hypothetical protein